MPNAKNLQKTARCFGATGDTYPLDKAALELDLQLLQGLAALIAQLVPVPSKNTWCT